MAERLVDRVAVLHAGSVVAVGIPAELGSEQPGGSSVSSFASLAQTRMYVRASMYIRARPSPPVVHSFGDRRRCGCRCGSRLPCRIRLHATGVCGRRCAIASRYGGPGGIRHRAVAGLFYGACGLGARSLAGLLPLPIPTRLVVAIVALPLVVIVAGGLVLALIPAALALSRMTTLPYETVFIALAVPRWRTMEIRFM